MSVRWNVYLNNFAYTIGELNTPLRCEILSRKQMEQISKAV